MTTTLNQEVVQHLDESGKTLKAAEDLVAAVLAEGEKVASVTPGIAALFVEQGFLKKGQEEVATTKLATHAGCLEVIQNLLTKRAAEQRELQKQAAVNGSGTSTSATPATKEASGEVDRSTGGFLGMRRGAGQKSAADIAFEKHLGM